MPGAMEVVIGGALVSAFVVVMVVIGSYFLSEIEIDMGYQWNRARHAYESRKNKKRAKKHRNEPIYERIAKAYEWKAELHLQGGRIEQARDEFRKADETRREAMEAMMNGQEPKL